MATKSETARNLAVGRRDGYERDALRYLRAVNQARRQGDLQGLCRRRVSCASTSCATSKRASSVSIVRRGHRYSPRKRFRAPKCCSARGVDAVIGGMRRLGYEVELKQFPQG